MSIIQRYISALNSSNLRDDQFHHATDVLCAVALTRGIGSKLFRVKYASTESNIDVNYNSLFAEWFERVRGKSVKREWPACVSPSAVARLSLDYWLNDLCVECGGKGRLPHRDCTDQLQKEKCTHCGGNGKRPIRCSGKMLRYVTDMVEALDVMAKAADHDAKGRLVAGTEFE